MGCESCKSHSDLTEETKAVKRASEITQVYDRQNRRLWISIIVLAAAMIIMAGCMVRQSVNQQKVVTEAVTEAIKQSQDAMNEAMLNALNTVSEMEVTGETTTTTAQTVEGDSATINNVDGEQYNDSATNQGGGN